MSLDIILGASKGLVEAPAGCGKTELIAHALAVPADKQYLVLTHTTAGVAALKRRLNTIKTDNKFRITTIASWALTLAKIFPQTCGYILPLNKTPNYPLLHQSLSNNRKPVKIPTYSQAI